MQLSYVLSVLLHAFDEVEIPKAFLCTSGSSPLPNGPSGIMRVATSMEVRDDLHCWLKLFS